MQETDKDIFEKDAKDYLPVFNRYKIVLDHGEGAYLWDNNGKKYLDWHIALPYLTLLVLNVAGLVVGVTRVVTSPAPEYLTLAINAGWIGYNLLILLAATAVAVEEVQPEAFPRVPMRVPAVLHYGEKTISVRTTGFSQHEILLSAHDELAAVTPGEQRCTMDDFLLQRVQILIGLVLLASNNLIATAEVTKLMAERDMYVER